MNMDIKRWNRQTYGLLDFLADIGGLLDILWLIGRAVTAPMSQFALQVTLMAKLFLHKMPSSEQTFPDWIRHDFTSPSRITDIDFWRA